MGRKHTHTHTQYNTLLIPDTILLIQCYFVISIGEPVYMPSMKRFCIICSLFLSHLNVLTFFPPDWGMLRRSRRVLIFIFYTSTARQEYATLIFFVHYVHNYRQTPHRCCCMYCHTYSKSMDQPGKVASPARGQLNRKNELFAVRVRA